MELIQRICNQYNYSKKISEDLISKNGDSMWIHWILPKLTNTLNVPI